MPHYRKRPITIEAVQFLGCDENEHGDHMTRFATAAPDWLRDEMEDQTIMPSGLFSDTLDVMTLTGKLTAKPGDWILKGIEGEIYVCPDSIFSASYDEVG